jgi:hypothetical protein
LKNAFHQPVPNRPRAGFAFRLGSKPPSDVRLHARSMAVHSYSANRKKGRARSPLRAASGMRSPIRQRTKLGARTPSTSIKGRL